MLGFGLAGGGFGDDFARCGVDDRDGVGEFGADVEQAVGSEGRLVRSAAACQFDGGSELTLLQVDDVYGGRRCRAFRLRNCRRWGQ